MKEKVLRGFIEAILNEVAHLRELGPGPEEQNHLTTLEAKAREALLLLKKNGGPNRDDQENLFRCRILILEDDKLIRNSLQNLLESHGAEIEVSDSGAGALRLLETEVYDVLVMDIHLAAEDGLQIAGSIRKSKEVLSSRLPILALTGSNDPGIEKKCLESGITAVFRKPSGIEELIEEIVRGFDGEQGDTIDREALQKFAKATRPEVIQELIELFTETSRDALEKIAASEKTGQLADMITEAHKLKSSSRMLGATVLGDFCERLEEQGASMPVQERRRAIAQVRRYRTYALQDLKRP